MDENDDLPKKQKYPKKEIEVRIIMDVHDKHQEKQECQWK
jgi:hypothetical protein